MNDLPERLRHLAESLIGDDWSHPLCSREACLEAASVLDKLPKTADGVVWTGNAAVWYLNETWTGLKILSNDSRGEFQFTWSLDKERSGQKEMFAVFPIGYGVKVPLRFCYSTQAAAEAAKKGEP